MGVTVMDRLVDLVDGVRLSVRPLMTAEVLRNTKETTVNSSLDRSCSEHVRTSPWVKLFKGERINDHHLTVAE